MDAMTTTLLGSTHQAVGLIARIGRECAREAGVEFLEADWRPLAAEGHARARAMRLYLQQYCGCVFSECERYGETTKHIYRGPGPAVDRT
jgi:predicted adenine nucleotide alpha hydrolase (AANH) superfamily ATPase